MNKLIAGLLILASAHAHAQPRQVVARPTVVELFTSQGCSSCPPADAIVAELAQTRPDLLPLTFHVTYWNRLGWEDPFSFQAATDRQRRYVALSVSPQVYTPAMVIDGERDVVGSDGPAVVAALAHTRPAAGIEIDLSRIGQEVDVAVAAGSGRASIVLIGFDRQHRTAVARGENGGRTLTEANIVRSFASIGAWSGQPTRLRAPAPVGEDVAVLLQADDGRIIGAQRLSRR